MRPNNNPSKENESKSRSKSRLSQEQPAKIYPTQMYTPMREFPPGPDGRQRLNYCQKALVEDLEPWEKKVPLEEYGDYTPERQDPKPFEQHQIDQTQKRITEYLNIKSKTSQKLPTDQPQNPISQKPKPEQLSPLRQKSQKNDEYKVVIKQSPIQKPRAKEQSFYKNNDIYGVEDQILNSYRSENSSENREIEEPVHVPYQEVQIDRPLMPAPEVFEDKIQEKPIFCFSSSNESKETPTSRVQDVQNTDRNNLLFFNSKSAKQENVHMTSRNSQEVANSKETVQIDGPNNIQSTESGQGVQFFYNQKGDVIYTSEAYKQPFSQENVKAYVEPAILPQKLEVENDNEKSQELNRPVLPGVPQALKSPQSARKVIIYRKEDDLDKILDYLGMEEQKQPEPVLTLEKEQKQQEKKQEGNNVKSQPQAQEQTKPIRMLNISDLNAHNVSQEQIQITGAHSLADRPHPIINSVQRTINTASVRKEVQKTGIAKKTTQKKSFLKANTGSRFNTPSRYDDDQQSRSNSIPVPDGSVYHFEIIPNKVSKKKNIVQVRRSSRIYTRSRVKKQEQETMKQIQQDQNENFTNTITTNKMQEIKQNKKDSKKSKSKSIKSKSIAKSVSKQKTESEDEQITIEWLKEHVGELNEIVINYAYMEHEYYAMTEKDQAISRFLQELQDGKEKIEYKQHQTKEEQPVRQNRLIKPSQKSSKKGKSSKKTSMKSKSKPMLIINQKRSKSKANIKIERTVDILVKNNSNQDIPESQIDYNGLQNGLLLEHKVPQQQINEASHSLSRQNNYSHGENRLLTEKQKKQRFNQNKAKYQIPQELPITVQQVVDPDILGLGVYALVRLGRLSEFQFGTQYAITPLCIIKFARRKHVLTALEQSKKLVPPEYSENIALIALNSMLIELIEKATLEKNDRENQKPEDNEEKEGEIRKSQN